MSRTNRESARHAAKIRGSYNIRPPDALQMAACLLKGASAFITNDRRLQQVRVGWKS